MNSPLIHIGYHKTGTTWLQHYLFNNRQSGFVSLFERKTLKQLLILPNPLDFNPDECKSYFYSAILDSTNRNLVPVLSHERFSGNPHSGGYDSKEIANRLVEVFPKAKVMIVIREQRSMILSTYLQYLKEGGVCSIEGYLHPPLKGIGRIPLFDLEHFKYHRLIKYYINLFGKANVLVLPYELFSQNPQDFVSRIMKFANAKDKEVKSMPYGEVRNSGISGLNAVFRRHFNRYLFRSRLNPHASELPKVERRLIELLKVLDSVLPQSFQENFKLELKAKVDLIE